MCLSDWKCHPPVFVYFDSGALFARATVSRGVTGSVPGTSLPVCLALPDPAHRQPALSRFSLPSALAQFLLWRVTELCQPGLTVSDM